MYSVNVVDSAGCSSRKEIKIRIKEFVECETFSAITPNHDGINDYWKIKELEAYKPCEVKIFNRWGDEIYSNSDYRNDWDGTYKGSTLPEGTYYYFFKTQEDRVCKGHVNILR